YLVRHAENRANVERLMSHKVIDYSLTELGLRQAEALGRWFLDRALERVYASPLKRARETAEYIAEASGASIVEAEALRELHVGEQGGRGGAAGGRGRDVIGAGWHQGGWGARCRGGESSRQAYARLAGSLRAAAERYPHGGVVAVGHAGLFTTLLPRLCAVPD